MANQYWLGQAAAVAQVSTLTVGGTPAAGQVYTATINGKSITYTAVLADTNNTIAAGLQAALAAAATAGTPVEFSEVTWTVGTNVVTATAATAGVPFTVTGGASGAGTLTVATTTASAGPAHWDTAGNWSTGSVPATGDSVYIRESSADILYGIAQSGVTLALLDIDSTYSGKIGLPDLKSSYGGTVSYAEYRPTYLAIGATGVNVGRGQGSGSSRIRLNTGTVQTTLRVYGTASPASTGGVAFDWLGTHASNALVAARGSIGVAAKPGTSAVLASAKVGSQGSAVSDVRLLFGDGCTLTSLVMTGGTVEVRNGVSTVVMTDGVLTLSGTAGVSTSLEADGGLVNYDTTGTLASYVGGTESAIDFSRIAVARTVTAATLNAKAGWKDPGKVVTVGGSGILVRCGLEELGKFDIGENFYIARA